LPAHTDSLPDDFASRVDMIRERLRAFLAGQRSHYVDVSPWAADTLERLGTFACSGKHLRANLVLFGAELAGADLDDGICTAAAAIELFQSGILVHDDIIDRDEVRRGRPAVHVQYRTALAERAADDAAHLGDGMAICAGDAALNLCLAMLNEAHIPPALRCELVSFWCREFTRVIFAEMDDVAHGATAAVVPLDDIMRCYRNKTARYTFALPLATGVMLAGGSSALRAAVSAYGEALGLVFQIKDDELGLMGEPDRIGKPVGSDIIQNKKTIFHHYLMELAETGERERLEALFGAAQVSVDDLAFVRRLVRDRGVQERIDAHVDRLAAEALDAVNGMDVTGARKRQCRELVEYSLGRRR
jgi:geranylgeranyl diphosphate synthase type I